jgi:hypothetical protein
MGVAVQQQHRHVDGAFVQLAVTEFVIEVSDVVLLSLISRHAICKPGNTDRGGGIIKVACFVKKRLIILNLIKS